MTRQELHLEMVKITDQIVEHYQSDFYDYDVETLDKAKALNHRNFIWVPRTCGTFLIPVDNATGMENWFEAILQNYRNELSIYEISRSGDDWGLKASSISNAHRAFRRQKHFEMEVTDGWGRQVWKDVGLFDTKELAEKKAEAIAIERGGKFWYVTPKS